MGYGNVLLLCQSDDLYHASDEVVTVKISDPSAWCSRCLLCCFLKQGSSYVLPGGVAYVRYQSMDGWISQTNRESIMHTCT